MGKPTRLKDRYEIKVPLGQGGMGVVYRAYDHVLKCDVAVKTIRDMPDRTALQLFNRECEILAALNHPNIVRIFDIGEFDDDGSPKPYFVMPLLPGSTLDVLIRDASSRLTTERCVEIMAQTCRGLQAAHENGLIHRDLKPSNIFVMRDDTVEIIDFGVAHMVSLGTATKQVGTLAYMAPETLEMKPPSPLSDIFALGVIAYELFTRRRPFEGTTEHELMQAILHEIPTPITDVSTSVPAMIGRVVHKAMAKQPWHRFATAREFSDALQKALRGELVETFDPARIQPRVDRARKAFEQGDHQFAGEILGELQAEGHLDSDILLLRRKIEVADRQKRIHQLLESARVRLEEEEYPLALQKVQEVLQVDPDNAEALGLQARIQEARSQRQIDDWFRLARQHTANQAFGHAREALQNVLQLRPRDPRALAFLADVDRQEQEYVRARQEREKLYQAAVDAYQEGELSSALTKLARILELEQNAPSVATPEHGTAYRNFYNQVRTEYDTIQAAYAEARAYLDKQEFARVLAICDENLSKYPGHAYFQALKFDAEERQRQQRSSYIAEIDRRVDAEDDLQKRVNILKEAVARCPDEQHFQRALQLIGNRLDLVNSIVAKARTLEDRGQFTEAIAQWEILRAIHAKYPGLEFEIERIGKRREQQARSAAKARWVEQFDRFLEAGEYERASQVVTGAQAEFPNDPELESLEQLAQQGLRRTVEAQALLDHGRTLCAAGNADEGLGVLRQAHALDERNPSIRAALLSALVEFARARVHTDWRAAETLIKQAFELDPLHPAAKGVQVLIEDQIREDFVSQAVAEARRLQAAGDTAKALAHVEQATVFYPAEVRLLQLRSTLKKATLDAERWEKRRRDLENLRVLARTAEATDNSAQLQSLLEQARAFAVEYPEDPEFQSCIETIGRRRDSVETIVYPVPMAAAAAAGDRSPAAPIEDQAAVLPLPTVQPRPAPVVPAPPPIPAASTGSRRIRPWHIAAGLLTLALAIVSARWLVHPGTPAIALVEVRIRTNPPGAEVRIDGKSRGFSEVTTLKLAPGHYKLEVAKDGYRSESEPLELKPGTRSLPVFIDLRPVPVRLETSTDLKNGKLTLDGDPVAERDSGQFVLETVPPGKHTLNLESGKSHFTVDFEYSPGLPPVFTAPAATQDLNVVMVSAAQGAGRVWSTTPSLRASVGGQPAGQLAPEGLALTNLPVGSVDLTLGEGPKQWKQSIDTRGPALQISIRSGADVGLLVVQVSGSDQVALSVDGQDRGAVPNGRRYLNLTPGEHEVVVSRQGFIKVAPQRPAIRKGETATVKFVMVPIPVAQPKVAPDETAPKPKLEGYLQVDVLPADAVVTYRSAADSVPHDYRGSSVRLPEGPYTVTASARGYLDKSVPAEIASGKTAIVVLRLSPVPKAGPIVHPMDKADWDKPWSSETYWLFRDQPGPVLYRITPVLGTFRFSLWAKDTAIFNSNPRLQWFLNYKDSRNYTVFEIDKRSYSRTEFKDGVRLTPAVNNKPEGWKQKAVMLEITVEPAKVVVKMSRDGGKTYEELDTWRPTESIEAGKFGFNVPPKGRLYLANFSFTER
ncbi:MAG: protein kinase [Bryobacteraceae bacterium]